MAYQHLLDLYQRIDRRLTHAKQLIETDTGEVAQQKYQEGRIEFLSDFKEYLQKSLNAKLPRRIRKQYFTDTS